MFAEHVKQQVKECPNCGWSAEKEKLKQYSMFEDFTNKILKRVMNKLKTKHGYGIPEKRRKNASK